MNRPYYIALRPCGDFAVQKLEGGRIRRWGVYPTRSEAEECLRDLTGEGGAK